MAGDRRRADPAHEISREREHPHLERQRDPDRPAEPGHCQRPLAVEPPPIAEQVEPAECAVDETTTISAAQRISQVRLLPTPPPIRPSAGKPKWPKISAQLSSALRVIPPTLSHSTTRGPFERGEEMAQQLEQQPWRGAPHVGAKERLALAGELRRLAHRQHQVPACHSSSQ